MARIAAGSKVAIHYIGTLDNGRIFHSTEGEAPLTFTMGAGEIFPTLEEVVAGMTVGEARNVVIPAADAYGPRSGENVLKLARSSFPAGKCITRGQKLSIEFAGKVARTMMVIEVEDDSVTLDGNHPLAGLDLTFAIQLAAVIP